MAKKDKKDENIENQETEETKDAENKEEVLDTSLDENTEAPPVEQEKTAPSIEPELSSEQPDIEPAAAIDVDDSVSLDVNIDNDVSEDADEPVTVQAVKFASFEDAAKPETEQNKNLDILMDIKLQLTVELGRTEMTVKKVLELTRGSIVELQKVAGEPVELYANGKLVAQGEVVVIEDNFGLRITGITDPEDRLKGL